MRRLLPHLIILTLLGACQAPERSSPYETYGESFTDEGAVFVQAVLAEPALYVGKSVKMEGTVAAVCQMAGCWLTIRGDGQDHVRILAPRNEDGSYRFTVPRDISGRQAIVYGTLTEETLTEEAARHLAEDAGQDADVRAAEREFRLTARGVLVASI